MQRSYTATTADYHTACGLSIRYNNGKYTLPRHPPWRGAYPYPACRPYGNRKTAYYANYREHDAGQPAAAAWRRHYRPHILYRSIVRAALPAALRVKQRKTPFSCIVLVLPLYTTNLFCRLHCLFSPPLTCTGLYICHGTSWTDERHATTAIPRTHRLPSASRSTPCLPCLLLCRRWHRLIRRAARPIWRATRTACRLPACASPAHTHAPLLHATCRSGDKFLLSLHTLTTTPMICTHTHTFTFNFLFTHTPHTC